MQPIHQSNHQLRAIIWDMDGVLIDSGPYHFQAWRETLDTQRRKPISHDEFRHTFGMRNSEMLRMILGDDLTDEAVEYLGTIKEERYRALVRAQGIQALPGVMAWLEQLHGVGWRHAVASSAPRLNLEAILDVVDFGCYFDALVCAEDVSRGKPDPEVFLTAAHRLGVPPERCIVIEDAPAGVLGARRAGMACIGVLTSHERLNADIVTPTLADLSLDAVEQLMNGIRAAD